MQLYALLHVAVYVLVSLGNLGWDCSGSPAKGLLLVQWGFAPFPPLFPASSTIGSYPLNSAEGEKSKIISSGKPKCSATFNSSLRGYVYNITCIIIMHKVCKNHSYSRTGKNTSFFVKIKDWSRDCGNSVHQNLTLRFFWKFHPLAGLWLAWSCAPFATA